MRDSLFTCFFFLSQGASLSTTDQFCLPLQQARRVVTHLLYSLRFLHIFFPVSRRESRTERTVPTLPTHLKHIRYRRRSRARDISSCLLPEARAREPLGEKRGHVKISRHVTVTGATKIEKKAKERGGDKHAEAESILLAECGVVFWARG